MERSGWSETEFWFVRTISPSANKKSLYINWFKGSGKSIMFE